MAVLLLGSLTTWAALVDAASVEETRLMAVDMGAEWIKAAGLDVTVSTNKPPEAAVSILLNDQANRKSPPCIAFRCSSKAEQHRSARPVNESDAKRGKGRGEVVTCERSFEEEALSLSVRLPTQVVCAPALLLGCTTDEALRGVASGGDGARSVMSLPAGEVADRFLYHVSIDHSREAFEVWLPSSGGGGGGHPGSGGLTYTPEELTAMLLGHVAETARKRDAERNGLPSRNLLLSSLEPNVEPPAGESHGPSLGQGPRVRHAALTVPSFSTVAERQALIDAGEIGGLRVVRLVHSVTAAAVALAHYREEQLFPSAGVHDAAGAVVPSYVMVLDVGSRQTEAAVFAFARHSAADPVNEVVLSRRARRGTAVGRITLLAMATNRTLGGSAFDECIASYWDTAFLGGRVFAKLPEDATPERKRAVGKQRVAMLRAANKARERLSANREAPVTIDGVSGADDPHGRPFTTTLSRSRFEEVCSGLFAAVVKVRDDALAGTHGVVPSLEKLSRFEVVGGASRMPKLLDVVSRGYSSSVADRTLNGDEAVAVGTAYLGAAAAEMLPRKFLVREALTNDIGAFVILGAAGEGGGEGGRAAVIPVRGSGGDPVPSALFPAHVTPLPALKSIVLANISRDFVLSLVSPPALAAAALRAAPLSEAAAVCPGCFLQHNRVFGFDSAMARAATVARVHTAANVTVSLNATDVVLEVAVSESGLPYLHKVYVRAHYVKTESPGAVATTPGNGTANTSVASGGKGAGKGAENRSGPESPDDEDHDDDDGDGANAEAKKDTGTSGARGSGETATEAASGHRQGEEAKTSVFVRAFTLDAQVIYPGRESSGNSSKPAFHLHLPRGVNLSPGDIEASRATLRELQQADDYRYACGHLRNAMEEHLIALRLNNAYDAGTDITADMLTSAGIGGGADAGDHSGVVAEDLLNWRDVVKELSAWLDADGESASYSELVERNTRVERLVRGVTRVFAG